MIRFTRPKPILDSLTHNLLQQSSYASGTPKGKSKLKTIQALKRHKATTKRGGEEASKGKVTISDPCINPPCPVRYLRPKDRDREAQREKLGLISKARQREIDIQKKLGPFTTRSTQDPIRMVFSGFDYVSLGIFSEEELPKYKVTVEDGRRLAKEYSRVLMKEHREKRAAEIELVKMRREALEALPEDLKEKALERDTTTFPVIRGAATVLPPVEGYLERIMNAANKKSSSKEKLR
ncbi:unnamed protein product [Eruca vesicaria subsp. sativa]|uniref:Uncharacterized protein n=1 Tax=Eruca vesicaria subsp. sativa TaxID=29727 RepID=A0ABC8JZM1_ERUVS|nr:unnamed protein product [Eruca vesicaria subsp. sativa]